AFGGAGFSLSIRAQLGLLPPCSPNAAPRSPRISADSALLTHSTVFSASSSAPLRLRVKNHPASPDAAGPQVSHLIPPRAGVPLVGQASACQSERSSDFFLPILQMPPRSPRISADSALLTLSTVFSASSSAPPRLRVKKHPASPDAAGSRVSHLIPPRAVVPLVGQASACRSERSSDFFLPILQMPRREAPESPLTPRS